MLELIKEDNIYTLETPEGRQEVQNLIKQMNQENENNIFYFAPTPTDIIAMQNFGEYIQKNSGLKKAIFIAIEKGRLYTNFKSNTIYSYIDRYMAKNNITSVYIIKAVHDFIYDYISSQMGYDEPPTITINGEVVTDA